MKTALLKALTQGFAANRALVSKAIRELHETNPDAFVKEVAQILRDDEDSPGTRFILALLSAQPDYLRFLCDPHSFTPAQSAGFIRQLKAQDARLEWKVANMVAHLNYSDDKTAAFATHCLEVLGLLCADAAALPALRELLGCPSGRIRSKAALLIGRINRNPQWAKLTDVNQDPRVAANAVESIWGLDTPAATEMFREAVTSEFHRAAVNGAVGLYLARQFESVTCLWSFARHEQREFRAAAAWGMGRTGDPRFLKALEALARDAQDPVRTAAARASGILIGRIDVLKKMPPIALEVMSAEFKDGHHRIHIKVEAAAHGLHLDALHFAVTNGPTPIEEFRLLTPQNGDGQAYEINFRGPRAFSRMITVEVFTESGYGEGAALETGDEEARPIGDILRKRRL
jgi:HEAT repeat protein